MVSSTDGSPTKTCWNRRSSAGSFSMRSRYSSSVVAPIMRSSPRASIGLSMLPASIAPSAAPAPDDRVQLVDERDDLAVGLLDLVEDGLEPLLELAAELGAGDHRRRGRARRCACRAATRARRRRRCAGPALRRSAVLPTPGSPISTGLFLVRRDSTWTTRRISVSRPMTGSSLPSRAALGEVHSSTSQRLVGALRVLAGDPARAAAHLRRSRRAAHRRGAGVASAGAAPPGRRRRPAPTSRCSVETYSSLELPGALLGALFSTASSWRDVWGGPTVEPAARGQPAPARPRPGAAEPARGSRRPPPAAARRCRRPGRAGPTSRCSGSTCGVAVGRWRGLTAADRASWLLVVSLYPVVP